MSGLADSRLLLIGAGNMGGALLEAWLESGLPPASVTVLETSEARQKTLESKGVHVVFSLDSLSQTPDCILLAVKPQAMETLLNELSVSSRGAAAGSHIAPLYLSIAAGKTLAFYERYLGDVAIVRAMPNTPAIIGKGISALCANGKVSEAQKQLATELLAAAGEVVWLEDESQMDAVTALSGSGPAYVFYFMEALIEAGIAQGLPEDMAKKLVLATMRGSAELAGKSRESLAQLRRNVTSPGGTTEAAVKVLMKEQGIAGLMAEAVDAAILRSRELA